MKTFAHRPSGISHWRLVASHGVCGRMVVWHVDFMDEGILLYVARESWAGRPICFALMIRLSYQLASLWLRVHLVTVKLVKSWSSNYLFVTSEVIVRRPVRHLSIVFVANEQWWSNCGCGWQTLVPNKYTVSQLSAWIGGAAFKLQLCWVLSTASNPWMGVCIPKDRTILRFQGVCRAW